MAKPFGQSDNSGKQQENSLSKKDGKEDTLPPQSDEKKIESSSDQSGASSSDQPDAAVTDMYYITNSKHMKCGPTFISRDGVSYPVARSSREKCDTDRRIKIRRGVLNSNRNITSEDVKIVAKDVEKDWKELLKKLPGVTLSNLCFHQAFVNALDREESTNMAEIALTTWKTVLPEFSTIGNLSKALFNIGHPDIVTFLRP